MSILASLQKLAGGRSFPIGADEVYQKSVESRENINILRFMIIMGQLALLALIIRQFQIQSAAFVRVALLAYLGFAIHYFLPLRYRMPFFMALSVLSIYLVFGWTNTLWLIGFGVLLIAVCQLPISLWKRVALLLGIGALYALCRVDVISGPWSNAIWPILGSMFIFRIVVYLYDSQHEKVPAGWPQKFSYFFMLPNACFPLLPVVDYTEYRRTYYNDERHRIYQIGIDWMIRGIIHLILYRIIYQYVCLTPAEVTNPNTLVQFLVSNFLLYLRISGYFHLITGLLHLFGFNLLATHHRYCLSSSFTDFWRRINIYWKDFMMKLIYYPLMFKLRTLGQKKALIIATCAVFLATWLLHSYLWFWLRGKFPITWQDGVFWGTLAVVVIVNSLMEIKKGRSRSLGKKEHSFKDSITLGLKTTGIFYFICILWSLWTSDSFNSWVSMWGFLWNGTLSPQEAFPIYFLLVGAVVFCAAIYFGRASRGDEAESEKATLESSPFKWSTVAMLVLVCLAGLPQIYRNLGPDVASLVVSVKSGQLSRADEAALERGYYEELTRVDRFDSQLWELYMNKPDFHWLDIKGSGLMKFTGDFLQEELVPGFTSTTPYGKIHTNKWGMRDKEYTLVPASDTYRIVMLGASSVMGWGVEQSQTFEAVVESRLNAEAGGSQAKRIEIMNFAVPGYYPPQQAVVLEKALKFQPRAIFYVATGREHSRTLDYLADVIEKDIEIPYPRLAEIVQESGVSSDMDKTTILRNLMPYDKELLTWLYHQLVTESSRVGAVPVWVFLPSIDEDHASEDLDATIKLAESTGFKIINLLGVFGEYSPEEIQLEEWDKHPNMLGHKLVATRLYDEILLRQSELQMR